MRERVDILGVKIDSVTMPEALARVEEMIAQGGKYQVVTPNPEHVVLAQEDDEFRRVLNSAALAIPDGIGLVWASRLKKFFGRGKGKARVREGVLRERVTGTDLMVNLCSLAARRGWGVYFLGGEEGVAQQVAERLGGRFPSLRVVGASSADPQMVGRGWRMDGFSQLLFVAYGAPTQEKWIARNLGKLPVRVAMGVGGAFDFVVGKQRRAPKIIRGLGLEWFWRLLTQPWRWRRQTRLLRFILLVAKDMVE